MFKFFKSKPQSDSSPALGEVREHLKMMGYDLTLYGAAVALLEVQSGYSPAETASHIALTTMAMDIKSAGLDIDRLASFPPHAMALLEVLKGFRDNGMMRDAMWKNDSTAVFHVATIDQQQVSWIDKILSDPIAGKERLANSRITYA